MELDLQSLFGLPVHSCTLYTPPPVFGLINEGAIGQPRETISLCDPLHLHPYYTLPLRQFVKNLVNITIHIFASLHILPTCLSEWSASEMTGCSLETSLPVTAGTSGVLQGGFTACGKIDI